MGAVSPVKAKSRHAAREKDTAARCTAVRGHLKVLCTTDSPQNPWFGLLCEQDILSILDRVRGVGKPTYDFIEKALEHRAAAATAGEEVMGHGSMGDLPPLAKRRLRNGKFGPTSRGEHPWEGGSAPTADMCESGPGGGGDVAVAMNQQAELMKQILLQKQAQLNLTEKALQQKQSLAEKALQLKEQASTPAMWVLDPQGAACAMVQGARGKPLGQALSEWVRGGGGAGYKCVTPAGDAFPLSQDCLARDSFEVLDMLKGLQAKLQLC